MITGKLPRRDATDPVSLGLIGCSGYNSRHRAGPALAAVNGRLCVTGYDLPGADSSGYVPVLHDGDLARHLRTRRHDAVLIETPDSCHPDHVRIALLAGTRLVLCEKTIAPTAAEAEQVVALCQAFGPDQCTRYVDHYLLLDLTRKLVDIVTSGQLGELTSLRATLYETKGIEADQVQSHIQGMANFLHHPVALACALFSADDLVAVGGEWARYPGAPVPDTYRMARFASKRTGRVVFEGRVGKHMPAAERLMVATGLGGVGRLDRDRGELRISRWGKPDEVIRADQSDTGYGHLAEAVAARRLPAGLLLPEEALAILRLVEQAHALARPIPANFPTHASNFTCEWQLTS